MTAYTATRDRIAAALRREANNLRAAVTTSPADVLLNANAATLLDDLAEYIAGTEMDDARLDERQTRIVLAEIAHAWRTADADRATDPYRIEDVARAISAAELAR